MPQTLHSDRQSENAMKLEVNYTQNHDFFPPNNLLSAHIFET